MFPRNSTSFAHNCGKPNSRDNLLCIAESGGVDDLEEFKQRLRRTGEEATQLRREVNRLEALPPSKVAMPKDKWIEKRLQELAATLAADERPQQNSFGSGSARFVSTG